MAPARRRTWVLWLVGLISLAGLAFSAAGWAMAGPFAAAASGRLSQRSA